MRCELCGKVKPNCGPFKIDGASHASVCGGCKLRRAFTPKFVAGLERELSIAVASVERKVLR